MVDMETKFEIEFSLLYFNQLREQLALSVFSSSCKTSADAFCLSSCQMQRSRKRMGTEIP